MGGRSFYDDPLLMDVSRGVSLREAMERWRVQAWDLFLVLAVLRSAPFKPLGHAFIEHLVLKWPFWLLWPG